MKLNFKRISAGKHSVPSDINELQGAATYDKDQFNDLRNKLNIAQNQINELLSQKENLESKVLQLSKNPYSKVRLSAPFSLNTVESTGSILFNPLLTSSVFNLMPSSLLSTERVRKLFTQNFFF